MKIILASKSKRRIELMQKLFKSLKIPFKHVGSKFKEPAFTQVDMNPLEYVVYNATGKAKSLSNKFKNNYIVAMDTVAEYKGRVLGKPKNKEEARDMIKYLNGTTHNVITGICIINSISGNDITAVETTKVTFTEMSDNEIEAYLNLGVWKGLAAGYGIQDIGALFVEKIQGDYFNVVGFPIFRLAYMFKEMGFPLFKN
jgi:septum formation protein